MSEEKKEKYEKKWFGRNRYICTVLDEMRACDKVKDYSRLAPLIEEIQYMATRMEDALAEQKDLISLTKEYNKARDCYKSLCKDIAELEKKRDG